MKKSHHHAHPELWFRPSPVLPFAVLSQFFRRKKMTATLRLGKRDGSHPKGYVPGTIATVRLFDEARRERLSARVRITEIVSKPLRAIGAWELASAHYPTDVRSAQRDLSFFEGRPVTSSEMVSIVRFAHLT